MSWSRLLLAFQCAARERKLSVQSEKNEYENARKDTWPTLCTRLWVVAYSLFSFFFCTAACSGRCALPILRTVIEIAYPSHPCRQKAEVRWLPLPAALAATILVYAAVGSAQACMSTAPVCSRLPLDACGLVRGAPDGPRTTRMRASLCFLRTPVPPFLIRVPPLLLLPPPHGARFARSCASLYSMYM